MESSVRCCSYNRRVGHISAAYKHYVVTWGGFMAQAENPSGPNHQPREVWFYNCLTEQWVLKYCDGDIPNSSSGSTGVVVDHYLYKYGGIKDNLLGDESWYSNDLHRLNLRTLKWERLRPLGIVPEPCDKSVGWAYEDKIYIFGGYGCQPRGVPNHFTFCLDVNFHERGWNNQLICYDIKQNAWSRPKTKGKSPDPRAAHAADISGSNAFIFGGRVGGVRTNELFVLDMITMMWSPDLNEDLRSKDLPAGRSWHSFTFVTHDTAVLYGGLGMYNQPMMHSWEVSINHRLVVDWKCHEDPILPLVWHAAVVSKCTGELFFVGGVRNSPYNMKEDDHVGRPISLKFRPLSLFRLALNVIIEDCTLTWRSNCLPRELSDLITARSLSNCDRIHSIEI